MSDVLYYPAIKLFKPLSLKDDPRGILSTPFHPGGVVLKSYDKLWVGRIDARYENAQYINGAETFNELYLNNIERTKAELWSTHWMDVTFDSKIGCPLDKSQHFVYHEMSPLKHIRHEQATFIPIATLPGYWRLCNLGGIYYISKVYDRHFNYVSFYFVHLADDKIENLKERTRFNEVHRRRTAIFKFLLQL